MNTTTPAHTIHSQARYNATACGAPFQWDAVTLCVLDVTCPACAEAERAEAHRRGMERSRMVARSHALNAAARAGDAAERHKVMYGG
jgi:hypothetical protein